jgi:hypothetical protein
MRYGMSILVCSGGSGVGVAQELTLVCSCLLEGQGLRHSLWGHIVIDR